MTPAIDAFSCTYAQARTKFLTAAQDADLAINSYQHPHAGAEGEILALDVVRDFPGYVDKLLVLSSGCHGVEGYCGSAVQTFVLRSKELRSTYRNAGIGVLFLHALNPYGFSHTRRVTHENVDLNRNFVHFTRPLPVNEAYGEIHDLLLPETWPPNAQNTEAINNQIRRIGSMRFQEAASGGQYKFPNGMFYGGDKPTWSNLTLRRILRENVAGTPRVAWIDLHTGLGPYAHGERGLACRSGDIAAERRAKAWWGQDPTAPITTVKDGSSVSAPLTGMMAFSLYDECSESEITAMTMEFGTVPITQVVYALRAEHWLYNNPSVNANLTAEIKKDLRDAFYVNTADWKEAVIKQAVNALRGTFNA